MQGGGDGAGTAKPLDAKPLEINKSFGALAGQKAQAENICAPASTANRGVPEK